MFLRKIYGSRLNIFAPVNDLSLLSRSGTEDKSLVAGQKNDVEIAGGQLLGDEYSDHVVKVRTLNNTYHLALLITAESEWNYFARQVRQHHAFATCLTSYVRQTARFSSQTSGFQSLIVFQTQSAGLSTFVIYPGLTYMRAANQLSPQSMRWCIVSKWHTLTQTKLCG